MNQNLVQPDPAIESWLSAIAEWLQCSHVPCDADADIVSEHQNTTLAESLTRPSHITTSSSSCSDRQPRKRKMSLPRSGSVSSQSDVTATSRTTSLSFNERYVLPQPKTKSSRARSSSPNRKTLKDLEYAKPSVRVLQPDRSIIQPPAVSELRARLVKRMSKPYIPTSLRERFREVDPDQFEIYEHLIEDETTSWTRSDSHLQWEKTEDIYTKARRTNDRLLDETSWVKVAEGILENAIKGPTSMLQLYLIQTQKLDDRLLPVHAGQPIAKKAGLALGFDPQNAIVGEVVSRTNNAYSTTPLSQMADADTMMIPLACGIEVKERGGSYNEAISQLGVWCAAGLERMQRLGDLAQSRVGCLGKDGEVSVQKGRTLPDGANIIATLPPLVGWTIIGHDWKFHISWRNQDGNVMILGPWPSLNAGTGSHAEIWALLTLIQEVKKWLEELYWEWLRTNVLEHLV